MQPKSKNNNVKIEAPQTWRDSNKQFYAALNDPWYSCIMKLCGDICYTTQDYFKEKGYLPALMPVTSEAVTSPMGLGSDSLPVSVNLFGKQTYLADSMQFHLEYLLRQHEKGVFYIMPTFRGEDSDSRHLNQFFHIEAELPGDLNDLMNEIEGLLSAYVSSILKNLSSDFDKYNLETDHLHDFIQKAANGLPTITFDDAVLFLGEETKYYSYLGEDKIGVSNEAERLLMEQYGGPVWLTHLPKMGVPFYQADAPDGKNALCADLLMGIGETVGCGQRHVGYEETVAAIKERQVKPELYKWYLDMKKDYPIQTSGFGIGLERFLLWVLKHDDIRDIPLIVRLKEIVSTP